jgi:hypothetical protein
VVLQQFNVLHDRSLKNKNDKITKKNNYLTTFGRLKKEHYLKLMGNHFKTLPLGGTERFKERLDKFLVYHVGKLDRVTQFTDALEALNFECDFPIGKENKDSAIRTLLTKIPMNPPPTVFVVNSDQLDSLCLLDRDGFYTDKQNKKSMIFHKKEFNRLDALRRCLDGIVALLTPKFSPTAVIQKIQNIVLHDMKVPLPWDPQKVISAIGKRKAVKAYVEVYLCPLRTHIGKSPGPKTGELLSLVQKEFFSGIICS